MSPDPYLRKNATVYVVDDDEAVRDSLQWLLEANGYHVRTFESAEVFLAAYDPHELACVVVDIRMGGMSGLQLQDVLLQQQVPLPIVFITGHGDVPMAVVTMKKGAMDFIQKPFNENELLALIERMFVQARASFARCASDLQRRELMARLTGREVQVLDRILAGRLNKQIANDLAVSIKTVEAHRAKIMKKFKAATIADLLKTVLTASHETSDPGASQPS